MSIEILARYTPTREIKDGLDVLYLLGDIRNEISRFGKIPDPKMSLIETFKKVKEGVYRTQTLPCYAIDLSEARRKINQFMNIEEISIGGLIENSGQLIVS